MIIVRCRFNMSLVTIKYNRDTSDLGEKIDSYVVIVSPKDFFIPRIYLFISEDQINLVKKSLNE